MNSIIGIYTSMMDALFEQMDKLVHHSVGRDSLSRRRHRSFIQSHLLGGIVAVALYPIYLWRIGTFSVFDVVILLWFVSPFACVIFLSRTGSISLAHLISSLNLSIFVVGASLTGGINSFLIAWLVIVPLEAALSGDRRVIDAAAISAIFSLIGLYFLSSTGAPNMVREFAFPADALVLFGVFTATLYGGGIAMAVQSEHEESARSIFESEKKFRLMAENVTDLISVHDSKGQVSFASPAAKHLFGCSSEELLDDGLLEHVHVSDRPIYMSTLSDCVNDHKPTSVEFRVKKMVSNELDEAQPKMTDFIWVEMRCRWIDDVVAENDEGEGQIVAVTRDISMHKAQEIALLDARNQAEGANVAKTRFLANMSHELRTPLNAVIGFSDVLRHDLSSVTSTQKYIDYARLINEAGEHLLSVVNDILDMSKIEVGKFTISPEKFVLDELVKSSCDMMEPAANAVDVVIKNVPNFEINEIVADQRALKQMLLNLLSNAVKFSDEGSMVTVNTYVSDTIYTIEVVDQGIGIAAEDLTNLGNPFVQADSSYKRQHDGVGLGLSVVKGLAELHGGCFKIAGEVGVGTTASIEIPINLEAVDKDEDDFLDNDRDLDMQTWTRNTASG